MVDAQLPLAPRKHGENLTFLGLATEHISHCLTTRPACPQSGLSIDLSEQLPFTVTHALEDDVATGVRTHRAILVRPCPGEVRQVEAERWSDSAQGTFPNADPGDGGRRTAKRETPSAASRGWP